MNSGLEDIDLFDEDLLLEGEAEDEDGLQEEHEHWRIVADKGQSPMRIDKFLMDHLGDTSRNRIQKAAEAGCIRVDGKPVKSNYKVKPLQVVTLVLDRPKRDWEIVPEDIPLNIVYEDDDLLVIDKPAGMVVHPGCGNYSGTLVNALACLVIAKTPEAKTHLCHQFFVKSTKRQYNALVWGNFSEDEGRIEGNIGRNPKDRLQMAVFPPDSEIGKPAVTHYRVLERFGHVTLVECVLETGRTHQIRVHMKHIGHVLFNDERYGGQEILRGNMSATYKAFIHNCFAVCPRQALHARTLGFVHPRTGQEMFFTSDIPADMTALLEKWRKIKTEEV